MVAPCVGLRLNVPSLFDPVTLRGVTARNRIWLAPMCQYSAFAGDGLPTDWHLAHLASRAAGGFGLVMTEAAAVLPEGRISAHDVGLWNDGQAAAWRRITDAIRAAGAVSAVQLAHAGRKGSTPVPFDPPTGPSAADTWTPLGPTGEAFPGLLEPRAMTTDDLTDVVEAFAASAIRAVAAGFDVIEIHAAHGYLLHSFLSPLSNTRTDAYGGDVAGRTRLLLEVVEAVRAVWPDDRPLLVRLSATDWVDGGWSVDDSVELSVLLRERGVDLVDCSSAGNTATLPITVEPGYQVPLAARVREGAQVASGAVGLITEPDQAQQILDAGHADVVLLGRVALREPAWPLRAAHELGLARDAAPYPPQYTRGAWPHARSPRP